MSDTFTYHGETLECVRHMYNLTMLNERAVELAVARDWLSRHQSGRGLEVGNVLGHYWPMNHPVWDLHEEPAWYQTGQRVVSVDILDTGPVMFAYDWVVSISTIEHTENPILALHTLMTLVVPGGGLFVTFPTGVSEILDSYVMDGAPGMTRACTIARTEWGWGQSDPMVVMPYGQWANSVFVGEWENAG